MAKKGKCKKTSPSVPDENGIVEDSSSTVESLKAASDAQATTNFSQLMPDQIDKLRDAFQLIDQDNDGEVSNSDLKATFKSIQKDVSDDDVRGMMEGVAEDGKVGFPSYLSLMSKEFGQLPNKSEIQRALQVFSKDMEIDASDLRKSLMSIGMKEDEISPVLSAFESERMSGDFMFVGSGFLSHVST